MGVVQGRQNPCPSQQSDPLRRGEWVDNDWGELWETPRGWDSVASQLLMGLMSLNPPFRMIKNNPPQKPFHQKP